MLEQTFCHIPSIGSTWESKLWDAGITSWDIACRAVDLPLPKQRAEAVKTGVDISIQHFLRKNPLYFSHVLPTNQIWRMFPAFRHTIAYLDIETTGLGGPEDYITTIVVYDGESIFSYVQGQNLQDFRHDIQKYGLLVTYNGKTFDLPFISRYFNMPMRQAHIDLRYVLKSLGYQGGLKSCERQLGIDRKELVDVDGFFAVKLWWEYLNNGNEAALQTLLAYNVVDVVDLELLLVIAYNQKLRETPFDGVMQIEKPKLPKIPFEVDMKTVEKLKRTGIV